MKFQTIQQAVEAVRRGEPCQGNSDALIALGLRALLAAIGEFPDYRKHYIAKGGTILRLRSQEPLGRLSTDLDLSGVEFGSANSIDHQQFAADIGRRATGILQDIFVRGSADISVSFQYVTSDEHRGEGNPETEVYLVEVQAQLNSGKPTVAKSRGYKIDITCDEYVDHSLVEDLLLISYHIPIDVRAYSPLQSLSEKLRAILQKKRHFDRNGDAGNLVPRHLFDLAVLMDITDRGQLEQRLPELFRKKCAVRHIIVDEQTRANLLDPRLLIKAREQDPARAQRGQQALLDLVELAQLP